MCAYVCAGSLAVLLASPAVSAHRRLQQTGGLCAWRETACSLNTQAVAGLNPLSDLAASEADLRACFDPMNAFASCSGAVAPSQVAQGPAATAPAEAPAAAAGVNPANIKLTPLTIEPEQAAAAPAAGGVQAWDPNNPPDYSVPAQCPFDGHINPLTSGALPDVFEHKTDKDFQPFQPDDTPIQDDTICTTEDTPATEHAHGKVLMKDPDTGLCTACPDAQCTVWIPDPNGWYMPHCTGVAVLDETAEFDVKFPMPGDEEEAGWGPDENPHVHFECTGCGGTIYNKYYPVANENYCQTSGNVANMLMSSPDESNDMKSVKVGAGTPGTFYLIMQDDWEMKTPNSAGAKCWAQKFANPCPQYATVGEACDDVPDPKPEPEVAGGAAPVPAGGLTEPTDVCVLGGAQLDYPGATYPDADSLSAATSAECAQMCAAEEGCEASIFVDRGANPEGLPNCYFKEGVFNAGTTAVPEAAGTPAPRTITLMQPCKSVKWADGAQAARRRLFQAEQQCKDVPAGDNKMVCVPQDAMGQPQQLQQALNVINDRDAFIAECPMKALKDGSATMECKKKWLAYFGMAGCSECAADVNAVEAAAKACGAATSEQQCSDASSTAAQKASATGSDLAWPSVATAPQPPSEQSTQAETSTQPAAQQATVTDGAAVLSALPLAGALMVLSAALL